MTLTYQNFVNPTTLAALASDREGLYFDRAVSFLQQQFPKRLAGVDEDALRHVVEQSYPRALRAGLTTEQDLFKHLIVVAYWGTEFLADPAHTAALIDAEWPTSQVVTPARIHTVLRHVDGWHAAIGQDLADSRRIIAGFQRIYLDGDAGRTGPQQRVEWLCALWPRLTSHLGPQGTARFADKAMARAAEFDLGATDTLGYICLAAYFGAAFGRDPLYPWAGSALATLRTGTQDLEAGRLALGAGVQQHWTAVQEEFHI